MSCTIRGARLVDAAGDLSAGDLSFEGASITAVNAVSDRSDMPPIASLVAEPGEMIDAADLIVMPGFIDVHTHGGGGFNLHTSDADEIRAYARWAPTTGVTAFLLGVVGSPGALPEAQLIAAVDAIERPDGGAQALGIHLEGPFINERRRGAHPTIWLRTPTSQETERVLMLTKGHLRIVTLAPELPGADAMIHRLVEAGVTVSLGHSDATYEQALEAVRLGVTHVTHCYNAMRPLLHRDPGPLSALSESPAVRGEIIADGIHVHPAMMRALLKLIGPERAIIITDALAGAGTEDGTFEFGGQTARVIRGAARLADGTITGSVLTMDQALRNVLRMTGVSLSEASAMLSRNPARAARVDETKGLLQPGYDADLVVLDSALTVQASYCRGELAFATDAWRVRVDASGVIAK
ncbi:MAG TPA: N-acetylglucosamine-6-phosphate deacetylase [Ktedonobacterales bacterium]|jgi:N-acetylglucosamine-6-phosphate deacetylase|nr:N-acetylglucosamine-6-phosphate deacetylase [Ktedonobacterales bacterium]